MPSPIYRTRFSLSFDSLAAVATDQQTLACQFGLCQLAGGPWAALDGVVKRVHAFVVPRVLSLLLGGGLLGAAVSLIE